VWEKEFFLYIGRHLGMPVCLEGALKLKEISYIPTDSYAAGEMKHGPIALLSQDTPVVAVMNDSHVYEKVVSNVQEVRARGARVIAVITEGNEEARHHADWTLPIPRIEPELAPILASLPLQILAYRIASRRGLPIDQPRNLAKTVTVE
jgi:glucosamine--fructose-6-phosphate aminotransferase (isomerizing)